MIKPPPARQLQIGKLSVDYRDYAGLNVCLVEPTGLAQELDAMNALLGELLHTTSAGKDGYWTDEQLTQLDEARQKLGPVLDAHEATLQRVSACPPVEAVSWVDTVRVGTELTSQARRRIAEAPELLEYVRKIREVKAWREKQLAEQKRDRRKACPEKPGKVPVVFFAWEDAVGKTEWLFCDGSKVVSQGGKPPELELPENPDARPKVAPEQAYLGAAAKFPEAEIRRSPKLPKPKQPDEQGDGLDPN
jgi:hypothetical protein